MSINKIKITEWSNFFTGLILGVIISFITSYYKEYLFFFKGHSLIIQSKIINQTQFKEVTIQECNTLYANTLDELSIFDPNTRNLKVKLYKDKEIIIDDILYGYDLMFEHNARFAMSSWLGVQNQQDPSDAHLIQIIIWDIKPNLIIDLGTNTGGSAIFFASIMNYYNQNGSIVSVDIKEFTQNWYSGSFKCKNCINPNETYLWKKYVTFYKGSTTDKLIINKITQHVKNDSIVLVSVDASHEPLQVYNDMLAYAKYVTVGSYIIVQDTKLDRIKRRSEGSIHNYIDKFLSENLNFKMDRSLESVYFYTQHPKGFLKKIY